MIALILQGYVLLRFSSLLLKAQKSVNNSNFSNSRFGLTPWACLHTIHEAEEHTRKRREGFESPKCWNRKGKYYRAIGYSYTYRTYVFQVSQGIALYSPKFALSQPMGRRWQGVSQLKLPLEGIALYGGYRWDSIAYRGLMGHQAV